MANTSQSTLASKRQSILLNGSGGPRPLQLAASPLHSPGPSSAPSTRPESGYFSSTDVPPLSARNFNGNGVARGGTPRRQSSISYNSSPRRLDSVSRSNSLDKRSTATAAVPPPKAVDRRSTGSIQPNPERAPVTLVEKHAELLHFIAQKESKCLELRSSLAVHEAELLQLKRKWERIVSRGFDRAPTSTDSPNTLSSSPNQNTANGAVLDGIREGVQGVSRFIYAGLGELSTPSSPVNTPTPRRGHIAHQSNSSTSTFATTSTGTRLSQSSVSSLGEEETETKEQVLCVHDTGATPMMSPNPAFFHAQNQQQQKADASNDFFAASEAAAAKLHRRKSLQRDTSTPALLVPTRMASSSSMGATKPVKLRVSPSTKTTTFEQAAQAQASSSSEVPSSWLGSAGKKWEEIQRTETFTKSQKRASLMLSDVSQTITSALLSPPMTSSPLHFAASALSSSSPAGGRAGSSPSTPFHALRPSSTTSSSSLLDDDEGMGSSSSSTVMTPSSMDVMTPSKPVPTMVIVAATKGKDEDEDEWNW